MPKEKENWKRWNHHKFNAGRVMTGSSNDHRYFDWLTRCVSEHCTPDLLRQEYRAKWTPNHPQNWGICYHAAEALWRLTGRIAKPMYIRHPYPHPIFGFEDRARKVFKTHWFLMFDNMVYDPTIRQYDGDEPPYWKGVGCGFLTKKPSKIAAEIIKRVLTTIDN